MATQFSTDMVGLLDDVTLLNRAIYGGPDALRTSYLDQYDEARDPNDVGNRDALFVYDRYDLYLEKFGFKTLSSTELGFDSAVVGASESSDGLDHNYTYAGDLFRNNYMLTSGGEEVPFTGAGAVAQVALKESDAGNTLYLTFRGTDADGPLADGEAGTAAGQMRYYEQLKALINQVYDYVSDTGNDVTDVVVSGHSLGGTVADIFALYDGARFAALDGVKLSVIALASAGVAPALLTDMPGYDSSFVHIADNGTVTFDTPDWYFQANNVNDIVRNPSHYDPVKHAAEDPSQAPVTGFAVSLLVDHLHFDDNRLQFETPTIDQYVVSKDLETNFLVNHYADFYELVGTEFSKVWPLAGDATFDRFISLFGTSDVLKGTPGSNNVNGFGVSVDDAVDYRNAWKDLFVMGLSGDDLIRTGKGSDLIAGGADDDRMFAGTGSDILIGGNGNDRMRGGAGSDTFIFKTGSDADRIVDFHADGKLHDVIDLTGMRGIRSWADLQNNHIDETRFGVTIEGSHGETIFLKHVALEDLSRADFLL